MADVIWQRPALDDLNDIFTYIQQFDPAAAGDIAGRLRQCGDSLATFPLRGRPTTNGRREMVTVPPYILTYEAEEGIVNILSIRHGARRPVD